LFLLSMNHVFLLNHVVVAHAGPRISPTQRWCDKQSIISVVIRCISFISPRRTGSTLFVVCKVIDTSYSLLYQQYLHHVFKSCLSCRYCN
jgi:hypothetical protein